MIEAVENLALVIDGGFGRIDVLAEGIFFQQFARAETHDPAGRRHDRKHRPPPKIIIGGAVLAAADQPRQLERLNGEFLFSRMLQERIPGIRRVAELK